MYYYTYSKTTVLNLKYNNTEYILHLYFYDFEVI